MAPQAWLAFFTRAPTESAWNNHLRDCDGIWHGEVNRPNPSIGKSRECHHPILIDSGSPGTVVGKKWLARWAKDSNLAMANSSRSFRCGDGVGRPSLGTCVLPITIFPGHANQTKEVALHVLADVVKADVPLLISKKTLVAMKGQLNFITSNLDIEDNVSIQLSTLHKGHLSLPGTCKLMVNETPEHPTSVNVEPATSLKLYHVLGELGLTPISDADLIKAHCHLSLRRSYHGEFAAGWPPNC